jgi:hypothetical protein
MRDAVCRQDAFRGAQVANANLQRDAIYTVTGRKIPAVCWVSIAKDIPAFRRLGWRIVLVSFVANAGTFLGATLVAQIFHV